VSTPIHNGQLVDGLRVALSRTKGLDLFRMSERLAWVEGSL